MSRIFAFIVFVSISSLLSGEEKVGARPYEMVDAGRTTDTHPALVDFENLDGWTTETVESEAEFASSREQRLWGDHVGKLTYKNIPTEKNAIPVVVVKPPQPIPIGKPFDCVNFWVYGNNWAWESDASTPRAGIVLHLQGKNGNHLKTHLDTVRWKEWFLIHKKFSEESLKNLGDEPMLAGIEIQQGRNKEPRTIFFDNLSFYREELKPLSFEPRPLRNVKLPEGQTTGTNTGPGTLPFPNREETILPSSATGHSKNLVSQYEDENKTRNFLAYEGSDGVLVWEYIPQTGLLDDLVFSWGKGPNSPKYRIQGAELRFVEGMEKATPKLESLHRDGKADTLHAKWSFGDNEVEYRFQMKGKSLIVDIRCPGGKVKEFSSGGWTGLQNAKLVKVPYLVGNGALRPAVIVAGGESNVPLFLLSMLDHTRSNASEFFWENKTEKDFISGAACSRYNPKTDGNRNDFYERLFITASPAFEEVLPNIPNDKSPWKAVTAQRVWRAHGASNHDRDYEYWSRVKRYGMEKMLITDHETLWRDGGESFTFRTYAAPGKGGDEGQKEYTRKMHELGFIYGPYNNYTDYAPVNAFWNEDWVTRLSGGDFQSAWARCYNPKPAIAVQTEPKITEIVQKKFGFNTAYCDVHTAVQPWRYVDYDARVPGAGTFAATFFAYGEIMLHQKKIWGGPVYSEGDNHWYYSGLTDGNYGQDQAYFVRENGLPWIVDFDLLKMHPLENNFGMGNPGMFYGKERFKDAREKGSALDRFLAATLAFGHTGFLAMEFGLDGGARSYFTIQQIAARYGMQNVKSIRYADEVNVFWGTSKAIAFDKIRLNRLAIEYEDGLTIYVNGNPDMPWYCDEIGRELPSNGWFVADPGKKLVAWSLDRDGCRADYVDSPVYLFADVRGNPKAKPCRFDHLLCDRQLIVRKNIDDKGRWEMIVGEPNYPGRSTFHAVRLDDDADADAIALDFNGKELGPAKTKYGRGMVHVMPVDGAFSYVLTPKAKPTTVPSSKRIRVVPGETVAVKFGATSNVSIPKDAAPNTWTAISLPDGSMLDFDVVPLGDVAATLDTDSKTISFRYVSNVPGAKPDFELIRESGTRCEAKTQTSGKADAVDVSFEIGLPDKPTVVPLTFGVRAGEMAMQKKYRLKTDFGFPEPEKISDRFETGFCYRKGQPTAMDGKSGAYAHIETVSCGDGTRKAWAIHPPYVGGVGYTFLLSEPVTVPDMPGIAFSSEVGIRNGGDKSDGVLYRVFVLEDGQEEKSVGEINWAERRWTPLVCDLSPWRGKTVRFRLVADVGPNDNSGADWAAWSEIRFASTRPVLQTSLHEEPVTLMYMIPDDPAQSVENFSGAEKVELVYEGCGMDASDRYHTTATLNGVSLGRLPGAGGDETKGVWQTASLPLSKEAVASLKSVNRLELKSAEDHFKIRRFHLVATFADGSKRSTMLTNRTITHPGSWKYAEGESAPLGKPIPIEILF